MKRILALCCILLFMSGCQKHNGISKPMELREKLLSGSGCSFNAEISADYGDEVYVFSMACSQTENGDFQFRVISPDLISGITGTIKNQDGFLTFDDKMLAFPLLSEGQLTPVSGPWHILKMLRSGYISSGGKDGNFTKVSIDDSYQESRIHGNIWLQTDGKPAHGEIFWKDRRIMTVSIKEFSFL